MARSITLDEANSVIAAAIDPSVPGAIWINSPVLAPVSDIRGSSCTNRALRPSVTRRASVWSRMYSTVESQVSVKSAPNETTRSGEAKS